MARERRHRDRSGSGDHCLALALLLVCPWVDFLALKEGSIRLLLFSFGGALPVLPRSLHEYLRRGPAQLQHLAAVLVDLVVAPGRRDQSGGRAAGLAKVEDPAGSSWSNRRPLDPGRGDVPLLPANSRLAVLANPERRRFELVPGAAALGACSRPVRDGPGDRLVHDRDGHDGQRDADREERIRPLSSGPQFYGVASALPCWSTSS